ncbi:MAG: sigma-70 family RNA polymerase sigma factor [Verrucomicrobiota bacterium]
METSPPDDNSLAARAARGDLASFQVIVERYQTSIFRMTFQFVKDYHLAQDLAQEVFVRAFRNLAKFDPERGNFSTWLYTIARNASCSALRKVKPFHRSHSLPEAEDEVTPSSHATRHDEFLRLDAALAELEEPFKSAFILAEIEELPLAQVAEIEAVPVGTIKSRVSRAKERLRRILSETNELS